MYGSIVDIKEITSFFGNQKKSLRFIPTTGTSFERGIEFKYRESHENQREKSLYDHYDFL